MSILPETAINILPFQAEPLSEWKRKTDVSQFLDALHAGTIYASYGQHVYKEGKKEFRTWAKHFAQRANAVSPAPGAATQMIEIPDFPKNSLFGKVAKYVIAWDGCFRDLLAESAFYSLAHLLEANTEIQCSLLLASHTYYKQALQVLRSYLEELILPINFCGNEQEFNQWKANNYRTPPLRGRDGIIRRLADRQILSSSLANVASTLYCDLNSYIHGSENRIIHKNIHTGSWNGLIFKYDDFCEWAEYLCQSIELGIRLLKTNYIQWDNILSSKWKTLRTLGKILCSTCHNEDDFDISTVSYENAEILTADGQWVKADEALVSQTYHCRQCGSKTTIQLQ